MDTPGNKTPPIFSASHMGGNNHLQPHHIIQTLHADKAARKTARQTGQRFAGDQRIYSLPGNINNFPALRAGKAGTKIGAIFARLFG